MYDHETFEIELGTRANVCLDESDAMGGAWDAWLALGEAFDPALGGTLPRVAEPTWEDEINDAIDAAYDVLADLWEAATDIHEEIEEARFYLGEGRDGLTTHEQYETMGELQALYSIQSQIQTQMDEVERRIALLVDLRNFGPLL